MFVIRPIFFFFLLNKTIFKRFMRELTLFKIPYLWCSGDIFRVLNLRQFYTGVKTVFQRYTAICTREYNTKLQAPALQRGLNNIESYLNEVGLYLSPEKMKCIIYGSNQNNRTQGSPLPETQCNEKTSYKF